MNLAAAARRVPARGPHYVLPKGQRSEPGSIRKIILEKNGVHLKYIQEKCYGIRVNIEEDQDGTCLLIVPDRRNGGTANVDVQKAATMVKDLIEYVRDEYYYRTGRVGPKAAAGPKAGGNAAQSRQGPKGLVPLTGKLSVPSTPSKVAWGGAGLQRAARLAVGNNKLEVADDLQSELCASTVVGESIDDDSFSEVPSVACRGMEEDASSDASEDDTALLSAVKEASPQHADERAEDGWSDDEATEALEEWEQGADEEAEDTSFVPQVQDTSSSLCTSAALEKTKTAPDTEKMQLTSGPKTSAAATNSAPACDCGCASLKFSQFLKTNLASRLNTQAGEFWGKHHSGKDEELSAKVVVHWTQNRW